MSEDDATRGGGLMGGDDEDQDGEVVAGPDSWWQSTGEGFGIRRAPSDRGTAKPGPHALAVADRVKAGEAVPHTDFEVAAERDARLGDVDYPTLHATVVDALRHDLSGEALDRAGHEILARFAGLVPDVPPRPSSRGLTEER